MVAPEPIIKHTLKHDPKREMNDFQFSRSKNDNELHFNEKQSCQI